MTYRDMETFRNVVQAAPLYPLNSLMNQGFAHARYGTAAEVGSNPEEIRRELRSFFASGTCLQELYVTPEKMSPQNWDDLAECVRWGTCKHGRPRGHALDRRRPRQRRALRLGLLVSTQSHPSRSQSCRTAPNDNG